MMFLFVYEIKAYQTYYDTDHFIYCYGFMVWYRSAPTMINATAKNALCTDLINNIGKYSKHD